MVAASELPINIGIADVGDSSCDSNLLIAGESIQTAPVANDDDASVYVDGTTTIDVLGNDENAATGSVTLATYTQAA